MFSSKLNIRNLQNHAMRISKIKSLTVRWTTPLTGGLIFLVIFHYGYSTIDPDYYTLRDDGIITLSHARNLVDYGFIGVGPSGEKVEGYSAPVQFFVYALAYFTLNLGFSNYTKAQVLFCTFALGFIFTRFFEDKKCFALITTTITAFLLTRQTSFIQWHASGMENSITHILFALTAYILFKFSQNKNINLNAVIIPFLASISRIDGIYHIFPLLLIFCVYWAIFEKSNKGIVFLLLSTLLWVAYNTWRYYYFGTLSPNTAYAQDISIGEQLAALIILEEEFLNSSIELSTFIFSAHGAYFIFLALPFVVFAGWKRSYGLLFVISLSIIITGWFNPFVFGVTRLDVTRSTTQVAFFVFTAISCVFYSVKTYKALILIPLLFPIGLFIHRSSYVAPYYMCCSIGGFDSIRQEFAKEADRQNLPRPTVSNPDLGVMSWHKQFNIIDMGMLGSQIMAKLKNGPVLANYFFDFAAPDMIESHESWSCRYFESIFCNCSRGWPDGARGPENFAH